MCSNGSDFCALLVTWRSRNGGDAYGDLKIGIHLFAPAGSFETASDVDNFNSMLELEQDPSIVLRETVSGSSVVLQQYASSVNQQMAYPGKPSSQDVNVHF